MDLIQSNTFYSSTVTIDGLLQSVKKQIKLWQDLDKPWQVKLSTVRSPEYGNKYKVVSDPSTYGSEREFAKLLQIMHDNQKKFENIINKQDLQIVEIQSSAKLTQDAMDTIFQLQRNEDELRHRTEIAMQEVEILALRNKLVAAEELLSLKKNKLIFEKEIAMDEEEVLTSLTHELNVAQLKIKIRDTEVVELRKLIAELSDTHLHNKSALLQHEIELQKERFQELFDKTLYGTRLLQTTLSEIQPADKAKIDCNHATKDVEKQKMLKNGVKSSRSIKRLSSLANDLLGSFKEDISDTDDGINNDSSTYHLTVPVASSVVPISQSSNTVLSKKNVLNEVTSNNHPEEYNSNSPIQAPTPISSVMLDSIEQANKLPSINSLIPDHALNCSQTDPITPYDLSENTSSLELLSSVCPPPIPTPTTIKPQKEQVFLLNKLPPIKIPKSKLCIPSSGTINDSKRPTEPLSPEKVDDNFINKRLRTFVSYKPVINNDEN